MSDAEKIDLQQDALADELDRLIERFRQEYDLSYASVVGVLTLKAHQMMVEGCADAVADDDEEEGDEST